ncbi:MAG: hypothetical protein H6830_04465 [Planctomycetes bacterium]|nr:hypothetical protein [Planctomycetota bacterium]MCB9910489.1 hypothetical protein [Planctomycetota bacterium]MCB9912615.1 hypothetical protein [Planctomycetota bacterium]
MIHAYTREQALQDGALFDVTMEAAGMFTIPVAVTGALMAAIETIPDTGRARYQDKRGRLHDVIWMAMLACKVAPDSSRVVYTLILDRAGTTRRKNQLECRIGPGDTPDPVITIGFPEDF